MKANYLISLRRRRGFTFIEMLVGISISSLVMIAVAYLQLFSGRMIKEIYGQTRTRSSRMIALDAIRYRLMNARIGSCVVSSSNHRIQFTDPTHGYWVGSVTSAFYFDPDQKKLYYDFDINDNSAAQMVAQGPIDVSFQVLNAGEVVQLSVRSSADMAYGKTDVQDGQTSIYLRNPAL